MRRYRDFDQGHLRCGVRRRLAATVAAALLLTGCTAGSGGEPTRDSHPRIEAPIPELQPYYDQRPSWRDCDDGFQCARVEVPLDYALPSAERIEISVIRLPATGSRLGSLLINPGGPGASGIDYARSAQLMFTKDIRSHFDIVGFDPRGVGQSAPIRCMSNRELDAYVSLDGSPDTAAEVTDLEKGSRTFADACATKAGHLLSFVGTTYAARDMDVLRGVLGDTGLTYLGKSYGSYLGAVYADLFPKQVRALVLDGAVDPSVPSMKANEVQAQGFEVALKAFVEDSLRQGEPFTSRTVDGALTEIEALLRRADRQPLRNELGDGRTVGEALVVLGIVTPLYEREAWPMLRTALKEAFGGNGTQLLRMSDLLVGRNPDGTYSNQTESNMAINCVDRPYPRSLQTYQKAATAATATSPRFGPFVVWGSLPCAYWPVKSTRADKPIQAKGAPPILVVGTTRDPATPYEWAKGLASQLASGVLLGYDGDGHTAYGSGSACVDKAVDAYLIALRPPRDGTLCPGSAKAG